MPGPVLIGLLETSLPLIRVIVTEVAKRIPDALDQTLIYARRVGDLIVQGSGQQTRVIAALEGLGESQMRIEAAVNTIESTQMMVASSLGTVQALSMATFGLTSLTAGFMILRMNALNARLGKLTSQITDIEANLAAKDKALLDTSLNYLKLYEQQNQSGDLDGALQYAMLSANVYGNLVDEECDGQKRLPVLNYRGRRFLLSTMTELQCLLLKRYTRDAADRVMAQRPRLKALIGATYRQTVGKAPEMYLDPSLEKNGVTLSLMTETYQQLQQAGVLTSPDIRDASDLFEHLRKQIYRPGLFHRLWRPAGRSKQRFVQNLRYLIGCVEDANRIEGIRLLAEESMRGTFSFEDLRRKVAEWRIDDANKAELDTNKNILAYSFV